MILVAVLLVISEGVASGAPSQTGQDRVLRDANAVMGQLNYFWASDFRRHGYTYTPPSKFEYYYTSGNTPCGNDSSSMAKNAYYCPAGNFIDFDMDWFVSDLNKNPGDITTWWVLAHEWGHSVQANWASLQPGQDYYSAPYRKEVQADCLAGAFFRQAISQGTIVLDNGDPQGLVTGLVQLADGNWYNPATHGAPIQRLTAFRSGLQGDSDTCRRGDGLSG